MKNHASMSLLTRTVAAAALALGLFAAALPAQDQPNNPPPREGGRRQGSDNGNSGGNSGGGGGGGERQRPDMQQIRKAMSDRLKESLGSSDEEWRVLEPQIEKVVTLQRQSSPMMAMWGRGGGRAGGPQAGAPGPSGPRGDGAQSELSKASQELSTLVADQSASNDAINAKIKAFRAAREKARAELSSAQKELRELLSLRQEATLVSMGLLD